MMSNYCHNLNTMSSLVRQLTLECNCNLVSIDTFHLFLALNLLFLLILPGHNHTNYQIQLCVEILACILRRPQNTPLSSLKILSLTILCENPINWCMTDTTKYRNVSLSHSTYKKLETLSRNIVPDVTLSISKTIEVMASRKRES